MVESNTGRPLDNQHEKQSRASRTGQRVPKTGSGAPSRAASSGRGSGGSGDDRPALPFTNWQERKKREAAAQQKRLKGDVDALWATAATRRRQLAGLRQAVLKQRQDLLDSTLPLSCSAACSNGEQCSFQQTDRQQVPFFGPMGARGQLTMPVYKCLVHGAAGITVHPLQLNCVSPTPVEITALYAAELVEEFSSLQLLCGVSGHGKPCCVPSAVVHGWWPSAVMHAAPAC